MKPKLAKSMMLGLVILLMLAVAITSSASAQEPSGWALFGHDNINHTIVEINTATGLATVVGPTGFDSGMAALARSDMLVPGPGDVPIAAGSLFGLLRDNTTGTDFIVVVDPVTGTARKVVETERPFEGRGIAFGADGQIYVVEGPSGRLTTVDTATGAVTLIGDTGFSTSSLEWDPNTSTFFSVGAVKGVEIPNLLLETNPSDASTTVLSADTGLVEPPDQAFMGCTVVRSPAGIWYTVNINSKNLVTLDISAGVIDSVVGNLGDASSVAVCGSVFAPTAEADLAVTKTDSPDPVLAGASLTYNLTVTNNGPSDATGVTLTDTLPPETSFDSATPSQGSCSEAAGTITCDLGNLAVDASATIEVVVTVDPATAHGTILTNSAEVSGNEVDPDLSNNTATEETEVIRQEADLAVTKTDSPDPVLAGDNLTYTLTVTNNGPSDATGVTLADALPAEVAFVSATPSQGTCSEVAGAITCDLGDLAVDASATIEVVVTVDPATAHGTMLTNSAEVSGNEEDPNPDNNMATEETEVIRQADLSVVKTDDPDPVDGGALLTYTLVASNAGPNTAEAVEVVDTLPAEVTFEGVAGDGWTCGEAAGVVTCTRPSLPVGDAPPILITVTAPTPESDIDIMNSVTVSSDTPDPNPDNNSDTEPTRVVVPPPGADKISARVFIDFRCDGYFSGRLDIPLGGVPVTTKFLVNGASRTLLTSSFGMVYFAGIDVSGGVEVSV
ncbi:MAG: hypothetical protein ACE5HA_17055, partial [Anaerolineae bacterium]